MPNAELSDPTGPTEVTIRSARAEDVEAVLALRVLMYEAMTTPTEAVAAQPWRDAAADWFLAHLDDPHVRVLLAEVDGEIAAVGIGQVLDLMPAPMRMGASGLITNVATFPAFRRRGLGDLVMRALIAWFEEDTDVRMLSLNATGSGARIYERLGFAGSDYPELRRPVRR